MARGYTSGLMTGLALSMAAALLGPLWRPAVSRWGRPAAKAAIKQGLVAYELGRERLAEFGETVEDVLAEAQVELATERLRSAAAESAARQSQTPADAA
jgi:hypothetical protein